MTVLSAAFLLLMVMDPMGNVPFFIAAEAILPASCGCSVTLPSPYMSHANAT